MIVQLTLAFTPPVLRCQRISQLRGALFGVVPVPRAVSGLCVQGVAAGTAVTAGALSLCPVHVLGMPKGVMPERAGSYKTGARDPRGHEKLH